MGNQLQGGSSCHFLVLKMLYMSGGNFLEYMSGGNFLEYMSLLPGGLKGVHVINNMGYGDNKN